MWRILRETIALVVTLDSFSRCNNFDVIDDTGESEIFSTDTSIPVNATAKGDKWPPIKLIHKKGKKAMNIKNTKFYEKYHAASYNTTKNDSSIKEMAKQIQSTAMVIEKTDPLIASKTLSKSNRDSSETHKEDVVNDVCPHFKYGASKFSLNKMAAVWQTAYYQLPEKVQCFKIDIKQVTPEEQTHYKTKYGNYSGKIIWDENNLEIKSKTLFNRKHFLQGVDDDNGVLDNIIIEKILKDKNDAVTVLDNLLEESADQWLVVNNLLLMRDCDTGGVVVFSKVPHQPDLDEISDALKDFGEDLKNGKMACEEEEVNSKTFVENSEEDSVSVYQ